MKLTLSGNFIHPNSTNIIVTSRLIDIIKRNKHKHAIASISNNVTRCVTGCRPRTPPRPCPALVLGQYGPAHLYRRMRLPARVLQEREGDRYILSRNAGPAAHAASAEGSR